MIDSISNERKKAQALAELAWALSQEGLWQEAKRVIDSISNERKKAEEPAELVGASSQAGLSQDGEGVIGSKFDEFIEASLFEDIKDDALAELARALSEAGHWQEAEQTIGSISGRRKKANELAELARALSEAGHWQEAERVFGSIDDEEQGLRWKKSDIQVEIVKALIEVEKWQEAERVIGSLFNTKMKKQALNSLVAGIARHGQQSRAISIIQKKWFKSVSRDGALDKFSLVFSLIPYYPDLGIQLYDTFAWVDNFLQG